MRTRELELVAAVLLFPPRFAVMAVAEVLAYLVCSIATIGHDPAVPLVPWRSQAAHAECRRAVLPRRASNHWHLERAHRRDARPIS